MKMEKKKKVKRFKSKEGNLEGIEREMIKGIGEMVASLIEIIGKSVKRKIGKVVFVSRRFDVESGSGVWMIAGKELEKIKEMFDVKKIKVIEQKNLKSSKVVHDLVKVPLLCLWYRLRGYKKFVFYQENQAIVVPLLRLTFASSDVMYHDLMRIKGKITDRKSVKDIVDYLYYKFVYWAASFANFIVVNSTKTKKEVEEKYNVKTTVYDMSVVCNYQSRKITDRGLRNVRWDVIGYVGSLSERKRVRMLVELAKVIKKAKFHYKVEVWGKGELEEDIKKDIKENKLDKIIKLKGHLKEKDKEKVIKSFGCIFFPTKEEGYGIPILEGNLADVTVYVLKDAELPEETRNMARVVEDVDELLADVMFNEIKRNGWKVENGIGKE